MKIATWNINGVNRRLDNVLNWLQDAAPDVLCLQELKCAPVNFPADAIEAAGYGAVWRAEGRWNGVAILARGAVPVLTGTELPGNPDDFQARYIEAAVNGHLITSIYAPNGNPQPGPKFDYKLAWMDRLRRHAAQILKNDVPIILAGDFNVVPEPRDIYDTRSYDKNALVQSESRSALDRLLETGLADAFRQLKPDEIAYTFWDYRRRRLERNAGLRIDHLLLNSNAAKTLKSVVIETSERGRSNSSDHAPVMIELS